MDTNILSPTEDARVAHLNVQIVDLAGECDALRECLQAALARLHATTTELTRATLTVKALRRELCRYTAQQTLGRAA